MLIPYHVELLRFLTERSIAFLVIGGQAERLLSGRATSDLDLWVSKDERNFASFRAAIRQWFSRHPTHAPSIGFLMIDERCQLRIPTADRVLYQAGHEILELSKECGVDILFAIEGMDFDACLQRSLELEMEGFQIRHFSRSDLDSAAAARRRAEN